MANEVQKSYDAVAPKYAELFLSDLDRDDNARQWLARFAQRAARQSGPVADLGCGPGHVVNHLTKLGLVVVGYDLSPGQVAQAIQAFPALTFAVGDFAALEVETASLGGIVARYSILHSEPALLPAVFAEWMRVLEPGAPVLLSFYGSLCADTHGAAFDHSVVTAYELHPAAVASLLQAGGFAKLEVGEEPPEDGGRPFNQATILAHAAPNQ